MTAEEFHGRICDIAAKYNVKPACSGAWEDEGERASTESWCRKKKVSIYLGEDSYSNLITYLKVWGPNMTTEMEDGELTDLQDAEPLFAWLTT